MNFNVNRFWDLETIGIHEKENLILHDLQDSIYLNDEGRYETRLFFKESHKTLPDSCSLCEIRLLRLYNKLKNDTFLPKNTVQFLLSKGK